MKDEALLMTDTHLMESTIDVNISIWRQAIDKCKERGLTRIFHLGDVLDSRKAQSQEILCYLDSLLKMVNDAGIEMIIIAGNHDKTNYQNSDSFLVPFKHYPNIQLVETYLSFKTNSGLGIHFMPFFDEKSGLYADYIKLHQPKKIADVNVLLTHVGVNDAKMNSGVKIENHIEGSLFDYYDKTYIGHYHDYQVLRDGKIIYIGSTYQGNFGEDNKKGFQVLKSDGSIEFIQAIFPEYKKVCIDVNKATKNDIEELKKEHTGSDDNSRFVFEGDKENLAKIDKNEFKSIGIDVKTEEVAIDVVDYDDKQVTTFDDEAILEEWKDFTKEDKDNQERGLNYILKVA